MGNRKFRFSDMIPNSWFYKLKEMGKDKPSRNPPPAMKPNPPPSQTLPATTGATKAELPHPDSPSQTRKSYYFTRELNPKTTPKSSGSSELLFPNLDPPRKSSKKRRSTTKKRPTPTPTTTTTKCSSSSSSVSAGIHSFREKPGSPPLPESTTTTSSSPDHLFSLQNSSISGDGSCIVIDVDRKSLSRKTEDPVSIPRLELPRIRTERKKFNDLVKQVGGALESIDDPIKQKKSSVKSRDTGDNEFLSVKVSRDDSMASSVFKEQGNRPVRRLPTGSPRFRVRINSPRLARRAQMNSSRRSISSTSSRKSISSDSLAVVKSSFDPKRDFRESMVEMIVENNIRATKDLEELLACYLSLNSDEYHNVIIQEFRQIWFDLNDIRGVKEVVA